MKSIKKIIQLVFIALLIQACNTKEFQELNENPTAADNIDPGYVLAYTQLQTSGERYENWRAVLIYQSTMIQHFATLPEYWAGDKYLYIADYSASLWERAYRNYIRDLVNLVMITDPSAEGNAELVNYHAMARIWKVFGFHRITDHYGDVPYFDAGKGYLETNFTPAYAPQEEIYPDMLRELEEAAAGLDPGMTGPGTQDLLYAGDVTKWKKFAYSMMLRLGMRLTKVDPAMAETYVKKALAGGVMESNEDICYIQHADGPEGINRNGIGETFNYQDGRFTNDDSPRLSKTFVDWMDAHSDPRLEKLSWVVTGGSPRGLPNGYNATTILDFDPNYDPDGNGTQYGPGDAYSRVNPLFVLRSSPMVFQTYAEVEFLTAEAIERGWHSGIAADHYNKGVRAAMEMYDVYDPSLRVSNADITAYLLANPYNPANWEQILGEQYWAATFLNEYEAYANWRRTGYPELVPVDYPGNQSGGTIPRRLRYPEAEASRNAANYQDAGSRLANGDSFTSRMWWDKAE